MKKVKNFFVLKPFGCQFCARIEAIAPLIDADFIYAYKPDTRVEWYSKYFDKWYEYLPWGVFEGHLVNGSRLCFSNLIIFRRRY